MPIRRYGLQSLDSNDVKTEQPLVFLRCKYRSLFCIIVLSLGILLLTLELCSRPATEDLRAFLQGKDKYVSVDSIPEGAPAQRAFEIQNEDSRRSISIVRIEELCPHCTSIEIDKLKLNPWETSHYRIKVDTRDRDGYINGITSLLWKYDGENATHLLKIGLIIHVADILSIRPSAIDFGTVSLQGAPKSSSLYLSRGDLRANWDSIRVSESASDLKTELIRNGPNSYQLRVLFDPSEFPIGFFQRGIVISCYKGDQRLLRTFTIPISGEVSDTLHSTPQSIYFGVVPEGQLFRKSFVLSSAGAFSLVKITSTIPSCEIADSPKKQGTNLFFECLFNSSGLHGSQVGQFIGIIKEDTKLKKIIIPFIAYVQ